MEHHLVRSIVIHNCLLVLINSIEHIGGYTTHSSCEIHSYIISSCLHCITLYPLIYQFNRYICFLKHHRSQYHILLVIYVCVMCRYMYVYIYMYIPFNPLWMLFHDWMLLLPVGAPQFVLGTSNQPTNLYWLLSYSHCCFSGFNHNLLMKFMFKMFMCTSFKSYFIPLYLPISPFNHYACFFSTMIAN